MISRSDLLIVLVLFGILTTPTLSAHSRRRVTVVVRSSEDKYDRSITTFDKTGRLLQVEYGIKAASRGSPIVAVLANNNNNNNNMADTPTRGNNYNNNTPMMIYILVSNSAGQVYRIDDHIFMFATGLMGDARALANRLRIFAQRHCLNMGEPCTVREMAQHAANVQHELTRTGGVRPLGCTAIIAGIDSTTSTAMKDSNQKHHGGGQHAATTTTSNAGDVRIFRTNPGGILEDCCYCAAGRNHEDIMNQICKHYNNEKDALLSPTASRSDQVGVLLTCAKKALGNVHDNNDSNNPPDGASMDVWMLEPCPWRRGKIKVTCFRNLHKDNLDQLVA